MTHAEEWRDRLARGFGENLKRLRQGRFASALELAEACEALGYPIGRNAIANIESGRKTSVPVHEVLVLARALRVPPLALLFDLTSTTPVAVLPDFEAEPWPAVEWFTGEGELRSTYRYGPDAESLTDEELQLSARGRDDFVWYRHHDWLIANLLSRLSLARSTVEQAKEFGESSHAEFYLTLAERDIGALEQARHDLRQWRRRMAAAGLTPPAVSEEILPREPSEADAVSMRTDPVAHQLRERMRAESQFDEVAARVRQEAEG